MKLTANNKEYEIENGIVKASGKTYKVTRADSEIPQHIMKALKGQQVPAGYVWSGEVFLPREIAEAALASIPAKIEIEGLNILRAEIAKYEAAYNRYQSAISNGAACIPASPSNDNVESVRAQYPRAAAYLKAKAYAMASNYAKVAAGRTAIQAIENGEDAEQAIEAMIKEWNQAASEAVANA